MIDLAAVKLISFIYGIVCKGESAASTNVMKQKMKIKHGYPCRRLYSILKLKYRLLLIGHHIDNISIGFISLNYNDEWKYLATAIHQNALKWHSTSIAISFNMVSAYGIARGFYPIYF